jgi:two-component system, cell cycle response regulator DivK
VTGARILIVEDHSLNMELVVDLMEAAGYSVLQAQAAERGIVLAREERPALILMDVGLPGIDGLTATAALKSDPRTRDIPVVALTSHAMKGDRERILAAGCDGYITKPIDTRRFPRTVAEFIRPAGEGKAGAEEAAP